MIERIERTPNARDRDAINRKIASLMKDRREEILSSSLAVGFFVIAGAVILYLNRPASAFLTGCVAVILLIVVVFGGPTAEGWGPLLDWRELRKIGREVSAYRALLAGARLHVLHCTASDVVGIGDALDDIDEYVFEVADGQLLVVPSWVENEPGFPSAEFEIVSVTDDFKDFLAVHSLGAHLKPRRVIDPAKIQNPDYPFEGLLVGGRLADLN